MQAPWPVGSTLSSVATVELVDIRRGGESRYSWLPFGSSDGYETDWWDRTPYHESDPWFVQALHGDAEVGRVKLSNRKMSLRGYGVDPQLAAIALEIVFIEVACAYRRQGVGSQIVRGLASSNPDRRLVAFSEGADDFWASLGGRRYEHVTDPRFHRPLFIPGQG